LLPKGGTSYVFFNNITMHQDAVKFRAVVEGSTAQAAN
jgi:hypothetical protein